MPPALPPDRACVTRSCRPIPTSWRITCWPGIARPDGSEPPVLLPGNPVRIHTAPGTADTRVPWVGEDTDRVLAAELDLAAADIAQLRAEGVVA